MPKENPLLPVLKEALRALNTSPRFRVADTNSYDIAALCSRAIAEAEADADPAAILGAAMSLYEHGHKEAKRQHANLSEAYSGGDEFMRQVMRVATLFETWACTHVDFDGTVDCWPYLLESMFGRAVIARHDIRDLTTFSELECHEIAHDLKIPLLP